MILEKGKLTYFGSTDEAIQRYASQPISADSLVNRTDRSGDGLLRVESLQFRDQQGRATETLPSGEPLTIAVGIRSKLAKVNIEDLVLDIRITDALGHPTATLSTRFGAGASGPLEQTGVLECHIPSLPLSAAVYAVDLWLNYRGGTADSIAQAGELNVIPSDYFGTGHEPVQRKHGSLLIPHSWQLSEMATTFTPESVTAS
jgi:hypothetical protein